MTKERNYLFAVICLLCLLAASVCSPKEAKADVGLNAKRATIYLKQSVTLKMEGTSEKPKYSSEDTSIATISDNGTVYGKKPGKTTVTAEVDGKEYTCKVTVVKVTAKTYNHWVVKMADADEQVPVTADLGCFDQQYQTSAVGQTCSLRPLIENECRFYEIDMDQDGNSEWIMYDGSYVHVFTVYDNEIRNVAAVKSSKFIETAPEIYYQESTKTLSIKEMVSGRTSGQTVLKLEDGKCSVVTSLYDSVGQMEADGSVPMLYYKNGRETTEADYMADYQTYCQNQMQLIWNP